MHASVIFFIAFFQFSAAQVSGTCDDAESWIGVLDGVQIENCTNGQTCPLVKGTNKQINLTFTPKADITGLTTKVYGIIGGVAIPFQLPQENACEESGLTCPIKANEKYTYTATLPVKSVYPQISLSVKWKLVDDLDNVVVCTVFPVEIKAKKSS